jgi:hypothetical protein
MLQKLYYYDTFTTIRLLTPIVTSNARVYRLHFLLPVVQFDAHWYRVPNAAYSKTTTTTKPTMAIHGSGGIVCGVRNGQGRFGQDSVQKCHYASGTACLPAYQTSVSNYINILLPILFLLGATQTGGWLGLLFGMEGMPPSKLRPAISFCRIHWSP